MGHEHEHDPAPNRGIVLDIGGDVGALVVRAPRSLLGSEIEVSRSDASITKAEARGAPPGRIHAIVRDQSTPSGPVPAAVFPDLVAGEYVLWGPSGSTEIVVRVCVEGGRVREVRLPG